MSLHFCRPVKLATLGLVQRINRHHIQHHATQLHTTANIMNAIRQTQALNQKELDNCIPPEASWHRDYEDTAFIYIGGLDPDFSEGDIVTIFSQYGEPVYINLVRDKETGVSKGFAFLKYQDQRSCDLAVDNLGGASVRGRLLRVDHTRYKAHDDEDITRDNTKGELEPEPERDSRKRSHHKRIAEHEQDTDSGEDDRQEQRPRLKEEDELDRLMVDIDDEDPMKADMIARKQKEVDRALRKQRSSHHHRSRDDKKHRHRSRSRSPRRKRSRSRDGSYREKRRRRSKTP
jgi:RNA-binding motif protein, X-linked 2